MSVHGLPSGGALHVAGPHGSPPILFLHGVGGAAWSWRLQVDALATTHRLFVWEARGHGSAARVLDAGLSDYYTDAKEALAALTQETGRPAYVVGHSMGGLLAIALACDAATAVKGLFLIDPVYATGTEYGHFSPGLGRAALWLCNPLLGSFARNGRSSRALARWMFERSFEDRARMEAAWQHQRLQIPVEYPRMLRESFGRPTGFELRDFAREVVQPTFLLEGTTGKTKARFPELSATLEQRLGTGFTHETIDGGHYLQADKPDQVNERLRRFVRDEACLRAAEPA